jgi:hypothetical protein
MCHPYRKATGQPLMVDGHFTREYRDYVRKAYLDARQRKNDRNTTGRDKMKTTHDGRKNSVSAGSFGDVVLLNQG